MPKATDVDAQQKTENKGKEGVPPPRKLLMRLVRRLLFLWSFLKRDSPVEKHREASKEGIAPEPEPQYNVWMWVLVFRY
jgi:hypothetical protein